MRFGPQEINNLSVKSELMFDTPCDTHDFDVVFYTTRLLQALKEAGFVSE